MRHFVVHSYPRDGEHEYTEQLVRSARDATAAKRGTRVGLLAALGTPDEDTGEDDQLNLFDRIITIEDIWEIRAAAFAVLPRYLPVVTAPDVSTATPPRVAAASPVPDGTGRSPPTQQRKQL